MSEWEQVWRERMAWQPWSGLTVAECCEEAGVSVASFYRWKKLLTKRQGPQRLPSTRSSEVQASGRKTRASQFVPIALRDSSTNPAPPQSIAADHGSRPWQQTMAADHGSSMRIELPNGVVIHVSGDLDGQRLVDEIIAAGQICSVHADMTTRDLPRHEVLSC